ncbi:L,D-transpeptidase family protein [Aliiglaciecola sp. CAU 1673]|uniref:L,D-transpeptidase family protein n=1 Tax=Aliiglaciecola sp. CAU 1673 TaxID=3032595 RepID=UPI0023DA2518|nr:L,D-transpeptidase family protein [Aliiglaciecola sp. CAU 1673]MDF2177620.1 L,D-transpeptidase family protein [Aliiglaciecola sp. CAU 1673]
MSNLIKILFLVTCLIASQVSLGAINNRFQHRLEFLTIGAQEATGELPLIDPSALVKLYDQLGPVPLWIDKEGRLNSTGKEALSLIEKADALGLTAAHYHNDNVGRLLASDLRADEGKQIDLELMLSDGLLVLATHYQFGKVNPQSLESQWKVRDEVLKSLLASFAAKTPLSEWFASLGPHQEAYKLLEAELARVKERKSLKTFIMDKSLKVKDVHPQVGHLSRILAEFGYLAPELVGEEFTADIKNAVAKFQQEHSLAADGVVGPATRQALMYTYFGDENTLKVNMERWRWNPEQFEDFYVSVNIASFNLRYVFKGQTQLLMKTIVGKTYRKTPVFSDKMRYFVVNPSWSVPPSIARKDILPKLKSNPLYLSEMNMLLLKGWGQDQVVVDPTQVDWSALSASNFPYHIRQLPGDKNALGKIKFMFPNEHNVYLHDTNDPTLFMQFSRAFSSGCIRLEKPMELLEVIARNHTTMDEAKIQAMLSSGKESTVVLREPVPVHIQYWTAWADDDKRIHYRHDLYERDPAISKALADTFIKGS